MAGLNPAMHSARTLAVSAVKSAAAQRMAGSSPAETA